MNIWQTFPLPKMAITNPVVLDSEGANFDTVAANPLGPLIARLWQTIVILGGLLLLIYLIWGAFEWLTSSGEPDKLKHARYKMTNAAIGLLILIMTFPFVIFLEWVYGFNLLQLAWPVLSTTN